MNALEMIEETDAPVPDWHIQVLNERLAEYKKNQKIAMDFDEVMDDIEKDLK